MGERRRERERDDRGEAKKTIANTLRSRFIINFRSLLVFFQSLSSLQTNKKLLTSKRESFKKTSTDFNGN